MFFGKNQAGFFNQQPAYNYNMTNPYEINSVNGDSSEQMPYGMYPFHSPMGSTSEPYICSPCDSIEVEKPQSQVYVVQKGDTVYKIAQKFGVDWQELASYNHLCNPDLIYPGERLFIPSSY